MKDGLTRDQVLNMSAGSEMDRLLAKVIFGEGNPDRRWSPSTDITAAFEVVEKMKEKHWFALENGLSLGSWRCAFGKYGTPQSPVIFADTAPLAISRAALLAVMDE